MFRTHQLFKMLKEIGVPGIEKISFNAIELNIRQLPSTQMVMFQVNCF